LEETTPDALVKSESEAGYVTTRPRFTRARRTFKLTYKALTDADKALLDTFFYTSTSHGSTVFAWTDPITSASHNVRIKPISWQTVRYNQWAAQIELEEA
jgi:hypothetical protein